MTEPTPSGRDPEPGGATRTPLLEGEEPEPTPLQRAKQAYDVASDLVSPKGIALLLAVVVIAVAGLVGGWDTVRTVERELPAHQADETIAAGPFQLTVSRAAWATQVKELNHDGQDGRRYLLLAVRVLNTSDKPVYFSTLAEAVRPQVDGLIPLTSVGPLVVRSSDSLALTTFQPGLPTAATLVYQQAANQPLPEQLTVTLADLTWRQSTLDAGWDWRDRKPVGTVTLPMPEWGT